MKIEKQKARPERQHKKTNEAVLKNEKPCSDV